MDSNGSSKAKLKFSLRLKATMLAIATGMIPVLVIGGIAYSQANQAIEREIIQSQKAKALMVSHQLAQFASIRYSDIQQLARTPFLVDSGLWKTFKTEDKLKYLEKFLENGIDSIAIMDTTNADVVLKVGGETPMNYKEIDYYQKVLETKQPVVNPLRKSKKTHISSFFVAAPVFDSKTGKLVYVIRSRTAASYIDKLIGNTIENTKQEVGDLDKFKYLAAESKGKVFVSENPAEIDRSIAEFFPAYNQLQQQRKTDVVLDIASFDNQKYLIAYAPLPAISGLPELNWSTLIATEKTVIFAPQQRILNTIILGTLATALITTAIAVLLAQRATRPIVDAAKAVAKIGAGELNTRINSRSSDEIGILGQNIDRMAEQIQDLLDIQRAHTAKLIHQNDVLKNLARNDALIQKDFATAAKTFTEETSETIKVQRVSIWLFNDSRDKIICLDLYDAQSAEHQQDLELLATEYPEYFQIIQSDNPIIIDDVSVDLIVQELFLNRLAPLGITSIINVPIRSNDIIVGFICCEQVGEKRQWQGEEIIFVSSIANIISLGIETESLQAEVGHLLDVVSELEEGNLTTRANVSDRATGLVADTFNRLVEQLGQVIAEVLSTARKVSTEAIELEELAQTVATNTDQQAKEATQVLNLTEKVQQSAYTSSTAVDHSNQSLQDVSLVVEQGQGAIESMTQGIKVLQQGTDKIVQQMKTLGEFVGLADQFVQEQGQIAYMTQVLALNASLVAARASEQRDPRLFSAVAREFEGIATQVSNLAQQTNDGLNLLQQRTEQINNIVSSVDSEVQNLGGLVNGFTEGVDKSNQVFTNVRSATQQVVEISQAVALSNQDILNAAESTAKAMRDITLIAARTAKQTRQTKKKSEIMESLSISLLQKIDFFQLPENLLSEAEESQLEESFAAGVEDIEETTMLMARYQDSATKSD